MKTWTLSIAFPVLLTIAAISQAAPVGDDEVQQERLQAARRFIDARQSNKAIESHLDPVIRHYQQEYSDEKRKIYCARTSKERLAYLLESASATNAAIVIGPEWTTAYYMKAYALIDLGRADEGRSNLLRALELSPRNSQCLSELAHLYQCENNWDASQKLFVQAEECARGFSPKDDRAGELARALRGQGFNLVELGKFDEAEAKYQECLDLDKNDRKAFIELNYIRTHRPNPATNSPPPR